jgi:hypothetical protein
MFHDNWYNKRQIGNTIMALAIEQELLYTDQCGVHTTPLTHARPTARGGLLGCGPSEFSFFISFFLFYCLFVQCEHFLINENFKNPNTFKFIQFLI